MHASILISSYKTLATKAARAPSRNSEGGLHKMWLHSCLRQGARERVHVAILLQIVV